MWRMTIAAGTAVLLALLMSCSGKGGDDVAGPGDEAPITGTMVADVNGRGWAAVDASGRALAECYLFVLSNGDTILHIVAPRKVGNDTIMSAIFMDLPKPRLGMIPLRDTSTATWFVHRLEGPDTLRGWWWTGQQQGGHVNLNRLNLATDSAYATFAFAAMRPDSGTMVTVTGGRFALPFAVVHVTAPASWRPAPSARLGSRGPR